MKVLESKDVILESDNVMFEEERFYFKHLIREAYITPQMKPGGSWKLQLFFNYMRDPVEIVFSELEELAKLEKFRKQLEKHSKAVLGKRRYILSNETFVDRGVLIKRKVPESGSYPDYTPIFDYLHPPKAVKKYANETHLTFMTRNDVSKEAFQITLIFENEKQMLEYLYGDKEE